MNLLHEKEEREKVKQKKSIEDYLKVIDILSQKKEVHGSDIAGN